ncbi:Kaptin [Schistosoma japonicum]|nr:Kaptin [Schistosoma japonicum]
MNSLGLQTYVELFHFPSLAQSNVFNLTYMQSDNARRLKNSSKTYDILVAFFRPDELQWAFFLSFGEPFSEISNRNKPSENQPGVKIFSKLIDTNILNQVESDQNTGSSGLSQPQTCHSNPDFLHMDFKIINNVRLSSFGSQDGWFGFFAVDMKSLGIIRHFNLSHESPITSIKIFQRKSLLSRKINIFKNNGFSIQNQLILPFSTDFDHVNCASVDDFNLDGKCEIILGTFGQRLLYYEWELNSRTESTNGQFILKAQRLLPGPVFCISPALDLIGEGPLSLAVVTSRGLHIFQHDTYCLVNEIHHRLNTRSFTLNT